MVRITKLTDYAVVIMAYLAENPEELYQAREISEKTSIRTPTVSKLLKTLTKNKFLSSSRGISGGYRLALDPNQIFIVDLIQALEGPLAITECSLGPKNCPTESSCVVRTPWLFINRVITDALAPIRLSDLIKINQVSIQGDDYVQR